MKGLLLALAGVAFLCAQAPADRAWSILQSGAADKSPETRMKAVRALGLIQKNDKSRQMAEKALTDESPQVREAAAEALGQGIGGQASRDHQEPQGRRAGGLCRNRCSFRSRRSKGIWGVLRRFDG